MSIAGLMAPVVVQGANSAGYVVRSGDSLSGIATRHRRPTVGPARRQPPPDHVRDLPRPTLDHPRRIDWVVSGNDVRQLHGQVRRLAEHHRRPPSRVPRRRARRQQPPDHVRDPSRATTDDPRRQLERGSANDVRQLHDQVRRLIERHRRAAPRVPRRRTRRQQPPHHVRDLPRATTDHPRRQLERAGRRAERGQLHGQVRRLAGRHRRAQQRPARGRCSRPTTSPSTR